MTRYWARFYVSESELKHFEYHGPWWISGWAYGAETAAIVCAAICADSEDQAKAALEAAFDPGHQLAEWLFCDECEAADWQPFCDRFPRADWMRWPFPEVK